MKTFWILTAFICLFVSENANAAITLAEQQAARDSVVQLNIQKQQKQLQLGNNANVLNEKQGKLLKAQMNRFGATLFTGGTGNKLGDFADTMLEADVKILQREIAQLETQNQALQSEISQIDAHISQQTSKLSAPTKEDLAQQLSDSNQAIKNHEDYVNWLKQKNQPAKDIEESTWILSNEKRRRDQIQQQINGGGFRETAPPPAPPVLTPQNLGPQSSVPNQGPQVSVPTQPSGADLTNAISRIQNQLSQLQQNPSPPPGWSPVGESVAGPYRPSVDSQMASAQAAQGDIQGRNQWEQAQNQQQVSQLQNDLSNLQQWVRNGQPPPGFDWDNWLSNHSIPPQPTGGWTAGGSESGHTHSPGGSDSGCIDC